MHRSCYTDTHIRELAGPRSYERGLGYVNAVSGLRAEAGRITATVQGTERYRVILDAGDRLRATCDCPYGEDGHFCKHCVAVALLTLREPGRLTTLREEAAARDITLRTWLDGLGRDELRALLKERLAEDPDFKEALSLRAALADGDTTAVRADIAALLDPADFSQYGYIAYEDAHGYAARVTRAAEAIRDLATTGQGAAAVDAARAAISRLTGVYESADDSDGCIGDAAAELERAHRDACVAAPPDSDETAQWLLDHCLGDGAEYLEIEPADYRGILGVQGIATLRALGAEALNRNPTGRAEKYLMESLARAAADLDPNGYTHLLIAGELDAAGRAGEALQWAEHGLHHAAAGAEPVHRGLVDYVADRHAHHGRTTDALTVRRDHFRADRSLHTYRALDDDLVRRLIAGQFPQWAGLAVERFPSGGTVNAMYRLGEGMVVRLPLVKGGAQDIAMEQQWLPRLASRLPTAIPEVLGAGEPAEGYPWPWSVYRWREGENPEAGALTEPVPLAEDLAGFVTSPRR